MERKAVLQRIAKQFDDSFSLAYLYFSIILSVNDIHITKREKQLLAFIACYGISSVTSRKEFCDRFESSEATVKNMTSKLSKISLLVKIDGRMRINPRINLNFEDRNIVLDINLSHAH